MSKAHDAIREALYGTGLVQPVVAEGKGGVASFLCRQVQGQEAAWLKVIDRLLTLGEEANLNLHVCRRYVRRDGHMVFGWFVGVETKNAASLVEAADRIVVVLKTSSAPLPVSAPNVGTQPRYATDRQVMNQVLKGEDITALTRARPRAPEKLGPDPIAPPTVIPSLRTISQGTDEKGRPNDVVEMPLPHTYKELNVPNKNGKGAKATIGE